MLLSIVYPIQPPQGDRHHLLPPPRSREGRRHGHGLHQMGMLEAVLATKMPAVVAPPALLERPAGVVAPPTVTAAVGAPRTSGFPTASGRPRCGCRRR